MGASLTLSMSAPHVVHGVPKTLLFGAKFDGLTDFVVVDSRQQCGHAWCSGEGVNVREEGSFSDSFLDSSTRVAREPHLSIGAVLGVLTNSHVVSSC